jgi:hypothetical protein
VIAAGTEHAAWHVRKVSTRLFVLLLQIIISSMCSCSAGTDVRVMLLWNCVLRCWSHLSSFDELPVHYCRYVCCTTGTVVFCFCSKSYLLVSRRGTYNHCRGSESTNVLNPLLCNIQQRVQTAVHIPHPVRPSASTVRRILASVNLQWLTNLGTSLSVWLPHLLHSRRHLHQEQGAALMPFHAFPDAQERS